MQHVLAVQLRDATHLQFRARTPGSPSVGPSRAVGETPTCGLRVPRNRLHGLRLSMPWFIKAFIRSSLIWFALGTVLGVAMAAHPAWVAYRPAHAHMNVVGFLTMMLFGVGYQLLPRLFGHALHSTRLAVAHWWLANTGLGAMVAGFFVMPHDVRASIPITTTGGVLFSLGALAFVYNMWRTFDAADARHRARAANAGRELTTLQD